MVVYEILKNLTNIRGLYILTNKFLNFNKILIIMYFNSFSNLKVSTASTTSLLWTALLLLDRFASFWDQTHLKIDTGFSK
jgi:hypothetical protein